jgi:hypothetical protein
MQEVTCGEKISDKEDASKASCLQCPAVFCSNDLFAASLLTLALVVPEIESENFGTSSDQTT